MSIDLADTQITDIGARVLANAAEKSASIQTIRLTNTQVTDDGRRAIHCAMVQIPHRRRLMAFACGETLGSTSVRKMLRNDGDHAICTRVAKFLL